MPVDKFVWVTRREGRKSKKGILRPVEWPVRTLLQEWTSNNVINTDAERLEQIHSIEQQSSRQTMQDANRYVVVGKLALGPCIIGQTISTILQM